MIAALLLAGTAPQTAVEAERAFAAMAQTNGQWTAFRAFAADDAMMFVPRPIRAQVFLKDRADPPRSVAWSAAASFVSCDGETAANTGPWRQPDGSVGYFSTIWAKQADGGWKWRVDGGDALKTPRKAVGKPRVRRASCAKLPKPVEQREFAEHGDFYAQGGAKDGSLSWRWAASADGARAFEVSLWNGAGFDKVIDDHIAAPPPSPTPPPQP